MSHYLITSRFLRKQRRVRKTEEMAKKMADLYGNEHSDDENEKKEEGYGKVWIRA